MTGSKLKLIACAAMLVDHVGIILFPDALFLRYIGRLALPIFTFFIGVGCQKTHSRGKYFLRVFLLALLCQTVYTMEALRSGTMEEIYLNILFSFCLSMPVCFSAIDLIGDCEAGKRSEMGKHAASLLAALAGAVFVCCFAGRVFGIGIRVDYGLPGVLLPVFAAVFADRKKQLVSFAVGLMLFNVFTYSTLHFTYFSLLALPLLLLYNGLSGTHRLKWMFYAFYPLHLAVIYGIKMLLTVT